MPKVRSFPRAHSRSAKNRRQRHDFVEPLEKRLLAARLTGIDVSHFQGTMNWNTAVGQGIKFAFIRGSRTDTLPDTQLANNMHSTNGAKAKGLIVGVYHRILPFSNTSDNGAFVDPLVDAQNFYNAAGAYMGVGYMRPVIDVENGAGLNSNPVNGYNLSSWVVAWVNRLKQLNGNINPIIYTGHYRSNLNASVQSALPDLWIANWETSTYGNPVTGSGGPPTSPWNPSPNWKFWQYDSPNGLGSQYGAQSTDIDLDVFNGNDIDQLKQFVVGAPAIPTGPSPSNGATNVPPQNVTLNWNDAAGATRYDVYLDNMNTPIATNVLVSQYTIASVTGGSHTWKVVAKGASNDDDTFVDSSGVDASGNPTHWSFTASNLPLPGAPSNPSPANGAILNSKPLTLDWADSSNASSYQVWSGTTLIATVTSSQFGPISPIDGPRPWHVVAINASGSTTGPAWSFTMDTAAPTAAYGNQTPTQDATYLDFTVTYADVTSAVQAASLDSGDVRVTGPGGFDSAVTFQSVDLAGDGTPRVVTYRVAAPGGTWNFADNGSYNIVQVASEVRDTAGTGNFRAAGTVGTFNVDMSNPFAYMTGSTLNVQFDGTSTPILMATSSGQITATRDTTTLNFSGVTDINVIGTPNNDILQITGPVAPPLTFDNGTGDDQVQVVGGSYTFANDLSPTSRNIAVTVDAGATATFDSSQHLRGLTVAGAATLSQGGAKIIVTSALAVTGRLDLADNDLVLDYVANDPSPLGTWNGVDAYGGVLGMIASGRNGGDWAGSGLVTTMGDAATSLTSLVAADAGDLYGIGDNDTVLFGSETVDGSSVVVKYSWAADADMNGELNGDDYFYIDSNITQSGSVFGITFGDFDLNGEINGDDYFLIDSNVLIAAGIVL